MHQGRLSRLALLIAITEMIGLMVASSVMYWLRLGDPTLSSEYVLATLLTTGLAINFFLIGKTYQWQTHPTVNTHQTKALALWALSVLIVVAIFYMAKTSESFSRLWLVMYFISGAVIVIVTRSIAYAIVYRWQNEGLLREPVAILGSGETLRQAISQIMEDQSETIRLVGGYVVEDDDRREEDRRAEERRLGRLRLDDDQPIDRRREDRDYEIERREAQRRTEEQASLFGTLGDLERLIQEGRLRSVMLAFDDPRSPAFEKAVQTLRLLPVTLSIAMPQVSGRLIVPVLGVALMGNQNVLSLTVRPLDGIDGLLKQAEDRVLGFLLLLLALPVMGLIALAIRIFDGGPVIFRQRRGGFQGEEFDVYKFRTMRVHDDGATVSQATRNDPRVTPLGRILRRTSLDELPQFFNVLKGEMSIVGPRPHSIVHDSLYAPQIDGYLSRYRVKPGLTGWAQANGLRGETDTIEKMRQRVDYDLHYIENWSLMLDFRIIMMTIGVIFGSRNAN
jgi:putative colanic acid biosynthesis UDP-glucose lipid carrier transferase